MKMSVTVTRWLLLSLSWVSLQEASPNFSFSPAFSAAAPSCVECYKAKSEAYQRCRAIPPSNHEQRDNCFKQANEEVERCLKSCQK
jgi:hypothetical protein